MTKQSHKTWFKGKSPVAISLSDFSSTISDQATFHLKSTELMPGLSGVELLEHGPDHVRIKTNEGEMKRENIEMESTHDGIEVLQYDEAYETKLVTAYSRHVLEAKGTPEGIMLHLRVDNLRASGFLGLLYRLFGASNIGNALLNSFKAFLTDVSRKNQKEQL